MAGIVSLFATCSNDTVFGLPIFEAVLPDNVADVYSVAPVQLLIFNPLSMAVIALGDDTKDKSGRSLSVAAKLRGVVGSVLTNPIVRASPGPRTRAPAALTPLAARAAGAEHCPGPLLQLPRPVSPRVCRDSGGAACAWDALG